MRGRFLVVQINMAKHPEADGVMYPVNLDGYYDTFENAKVVADYLAEKNASLRTHVVEVRQ